jgi:NAD(P)H-hydrate repair Nnr-like enzyme with NAD(P)H-hydrate dehydratase domain
VSAACATAGFLGIEAPHALLVGDNGSGKGSRKLYEYLAENLSSLQPRVLVLHYMLPVMGLMRRVYEAASRLPKKPVLIADAAAMYAAKAAGLAPGFDIFTPDPSEIAFLADPEATHPAYMSRHLFESDVTKVPELVEAAYRNKSAAKMLLVKGSKDFVAEGGKILATVTEPDLPALEAIGGTGDTISGMLGVLIASGLNPRIAAVVTAKANRTAGLYAKATPATRISEIIRVLPDVLRDSYASWVSE